MHTNHDACVAAVASRDRRFDGRFITGVTSTGIYCKPSCPARTPKAQNMRFFAHPAAAQAAGFRACKRCLPDFSPGSAEWDVRADVVGRAVRLINDGVVDREGVAGLAARLGYSMRHIQRLLVEDVGAGPVELARAQRARTARLLLENTELSVSDVAFAAGFSSIRSCNDTISHVYDATPTLLRRRAVPKAAPATNDSVRLRLRLDVRQPFDPSNLFGHLIACAVPGVEEWRAGEYRRTLRLPFGAGIVAASPETDAIAVTLFLSDVRDLTPALSRVRRLFDTDADPEAVLDAFDPDPHLGPEVRKRPGRRVPRTVDGAELALRTVVGQQVSTAAAATVMGRIVEACGERIIDPVGGLTHLFCEPGAAADAPEEVLAMPTRRAATFRTVAQALADGRVTLDVSSDPAEAEAALASLPGVGPWTINTVKMRALADPDAFLPSDLGVLSAARSLGVASTAKALAAHSAVWSPWRSYAVQYLWAVGDHAVNEIPDQNHPDDPS